MTESRLSRHGDVVMAIIVVDDFRVSDSVAVRRWVIALQNDAVTMGVLALMSAKLDIVLAAMQIGLLASLLMWHWRRGGVALILCLIGQSVALLANVLHYFVAAIVDR